MTRVAADPLAAATELAAEIAGRSPDAVRRAKRLYDDSWTAPASDSLALEAELQLRADRLARTSSPPSRRAWHREPAQFEDPAPTGLAPLGPNPTAGV